MTSGPGPSDAEDEALVRAWQADPSGRTGRAALAALVERWRGRVYAWSWRVLHDREAALDAAQDSLLRMVRALPSYESRGRFSAWLFTIVYNRCRSAARARARVRGRDDATDTDALPAPGADPGREAMASVRLERVFATMDGVLDDDERAALWLRAHEGLSVEEITRMLAIPGASGARAVIQSARRKLRAALGPEAWPEELP